MLSLEWSHPASGPPSGRWWSFRNIVRSESLPELHGVYCIFQHPPKGYRTLWVGQGNIRDRLLVHAREPRISTRPYLLVTWAETDHARLDGVQRYLIDALQPLEGDKAPDAEPIEVNLPYRV